MSEQNRSSTSHEVWAATIGQTVVVVGFVILAIFKVDFTVYTAYAATVAATVGAGAVYQTAAKRAAVSKPGFQAEA